MAQYVYPTTTRNRGPLFWLRPTNLWNARRKFRFDESAAWRSHFQGGPVNPFNPRQCVSIDDLLAHAPTSEKGFRFLILGDTGEGDHSQYGLLPLIRHLKPDFMIIVGDVAYPAGNAEDFREGFFKPYANLGIPIWALPGNHEYYSKGWGREFFDIFCSETLAAQWEDYGLRMIPQPGAFWMIEGTDRFPVNILGVDSGMKGNLDDDTHQLRWIKDRLEESKSEDRNVMLLFHIPALVRSKPVLKCMKSLHRLILEYPCVRLVVCGHEHNYQRYDPREFNHYIVDECNGSAAAAPPHYIVCGGGGAYLQTTNFKQGKFPCKERYPTETQWRREFASVFRRGVDWLGLSKTAIGLLAAKADEGTLADNDEPKFLSFLLVEAKPSAEADVPFTVEVTPVFMNRLDDLFLNPESLGTLQVDAPNLPVDPNQVAENCLRSESKMRIV